jgi:hypothetical protein
MRHFFIPCLIFLISGIFCQSFVSLNNQLRSVENDIKALIADMSSTQQGDKYQMLIGKGRNILNDCENLSKDLTNLSIAEVELRINQIQKKYQNILGDWQKQSGTSPSLGTTTMRTTTIIETIEKKSYEPRKICNFVFK